MTSRDATRSRRLPARNAVVTGAGSGIGRAVAVRFAQEGARVAVLDRDLDGAKQTVAEIRAAGGTASAFAIDISDAASVSTAVAAVLTSFEQIDVLVNNAGIDSDAGLLDTSESLWDRILDVDLKGMFLVTKALMPALIASGHGAVVNTSSVSGLVAGGGLAYTAAKHGVIGFTRALSAEFGQHVRSNVVLPGAIETPMSASLFEAENADALEYLRSAPAARHGQATEVANVVLFLASDEASFVHGASYVVDGGWTVL